MKLKRNVDRVLVASMDERKGLKRYLELESVSSRIEVVSEQLLITDDDFCSRHQ